MWPFFSGVVAVAVLGWVGSQVDVRTGLTTLFGLLGVTSIYLSVFWNDREARRSADAVVRSDLAAALARISSLEADALVDGRRVRSLEARVESLEETVNLLTTTSAGPWGSR